MTYVHNASMVPCDFCGATEGTWGEICPKNPAIVHAPGFSKMFTALNDSVNHPKHYTNHPSGVECITITEHMNFCIGNAVKYLWRADIKNGLEDLKKARWYVDREITRREQAAKNIDI